MAAPAEPSSPLSSPHQNTLWYDTHDDYTHMTRVSLAKLHHRQHRTEPRLRRQVLIRNTLLSAWPQPAQSLCQSQQEEEWLDACFDQLDDDDDEDEDDLVAAEKPVHDDPHDTAPRPRWLIEPPMPYTASNASPSLRAPPEEPHYKPQQPITLVQWSW